MKNDVSLINLIGNVVSLGITVSVITISVRVSNFIFDTKIKQYLENK
jgi:hypothetical protein